jgi:hypothetical protein
VVLHLYCACLQIRAQQVIASDIDALEERLWHDVNEYQLSLQQHLSDRDGLLNKIDRASQQLLLLKVRAWVLNATMLPTLLHLPVFHGCGISQAFTKGSAASKHNLALAAGTS